MTLNRFCLVLLLLLLLIAPAGSLQGAGALEWDERFPGLGVTLEPAEECSTGCWRLITGRYEDVDESGLNHNVYSRLYNEAGDMVAGAPWHVAWPDGNVTIYSKAPPEWADFPIFACYNPTNGPGPYRAYAGDDEARSDRVVGIGLPQCQHVNFRFEWRYQPAAAPCTGCVPRAYLPLVSRP